MKDKPQLTNLPIDKLQRGEYQPRRQFDEAALQELAASIQSAGMIQPVVVRPVDEGQYEIIAGERRWRAAQLAGLADIPCLVRHISNEQAAAVSTIENIQRQDLNPIEEANSYQRLATEFGYFHEEVAAIVGKSRTRITNSIRLLKLEPKVQKLLIEGKLSSGHGKVLAGLPDKQQLPLAQQCINKGWSVRKIEAEAKKLQTQAHAIQPSHDPNVVRLEKVISEQVGSQVKVDADSSQRGGWLKIRYFDNDTLAGLLDKMGVEYE